MTRPGICAARPRLLLAILSLSIVFLPGCSDPPAVELPTPKPTPLSVTRYQNELAFDLLYPSDWTYTIVLEGLLLFGERETVDQQQAGASVSVFRQAPEEIRGGLEGAFQHYLDSGPLLSGYGIIGKTTTSLLGGKEALQVFVERDAVDNQPAMKAFIVAAEAESGPLYILSATAPASQWEEEWPSFRLLVGSFEFNE